MSDTGRPRSEVPERSSSQILSLHSRVVSESQHVTAVKYAKEVQNFANLPDGRGANHAVLASFLGRLMSYGVTTADLSREEEHFATSYSFGKEERANKASHGEKWTLNKAVEYTSCLDFDDKTSSESFTSPGRLLFLRGYPSADWLGLIGARYMIDSEFFMRFLHFNAAKDAMANYSLPALPATTWNMLELPVVSIGERKHAFVDQAEIDDMRRQARTKLQKHHRRLRCHTAIPVASSVIRDVAILDQSSFALEQRIWICLQPQFVSSANNFLWTLVVWTDAGNTVSFRSLQELDILPAAFQTEATSLAPVIDYKPNTGLQSQKFSLTGRPRPERGAEAASQLCLGYGKTLYEDVMAQDGFYALTEVFSVATASVNQYLNLLEDKLAGFTDDEHYDDFGMLSNLRYTKNVLYRQQRQIEQVSAWLKLHKSLSLDRWRIAIEEDPRATRAVESVMQGYEYLQTRVNTLQSECQDAISNLVNNINLKEVKNSIEQTKRMGKLTFLAFIFAPLSFTTSFFSMNIGLTNLTLTTWVVVSAALMGFTLFIWAFDVFKWVKVSKNKFWPRIEKALFY